MDVTLLKQTAAAMVAEGKGILAADESNRTAGKRLASIGMENTEDNRRAMREMLFSTEGLGQYISGTILFDETLRQDASTGQPLREMLGGQGIIPGIKVDEGLAELEGTSGEQYTKGLTGLASRMTEYFEIGARFAKWRAVYSVSDTMPSMAAIEANAEGLAEYAAICQSHSIVPIVEPEVMMDGEHSSHSIERCYDVTVAVQEAVFNALRKKDIIWEGMVLKPSMVIQGKNCSEKASTEDVARLTVQCLKTTVPHGVPGIAFLSGGQGDVQATANLNAMYHVSEEELPWRLTFSYGRALQAEALKTWAGKAENVAAAQKALLHHAHMNSLAAMGKWSEELEQQAA